MTILQFGTSANCFSLYFIYALVMSSILLSFAHEYDECDQEYTDEYACKSNSYCEWDPANSVCRSSCQNLDNKHCKLVSQCFWNELHKKCSLYLNYTMESYEYSVNSDTLRSTSISQDSSNEMKKKAKGPKGDKNQNVTTYIGAPIYVNAFVPKRNLNSTDISLWSYITNHLANSLKMSNQANVNIKLCKTSPNRSDLPQIERVIDSSECDMYDLVGNMDDSSETLRLYSIKMLIFITKQMLVEGRGSGEKLYQKIYQKLNDALDSVKGYIIDYHPPLTDATTKPNILMLVADDLGYGDVGYQACQQPSTTSRICSPKGITPNIDALANHKNSIVFDRFYAYSTCGPSRASIMSGRQPARDCIYINPGSFDYAPNFPTSLLSLPEIAKLGGYKTYHVGKWHVGTMFGKTLAKIAHPGQLGYDEWYATEKWAPTKNLNCGCFSNSTKSYCDTGMYKESYFLNEYKDGTTYVRRKYLVNDDVNEFRCYNYYYVNKQNPIFQFNNRNVGGWPKSLAGDDSDFVTNTFANILKNHDRTIPFFATLWFHNPHAPYISADDETRAKADKLIAQDAGANWCGELYDVYAVNQLGRPTCREKFGDKYCDQLCLIVKREYYSSIIKLDEAIGNIMNLLGDNKLQKNTLVIFFSDNGPARFDSSGTGNRYIGPGSTAGLPGYKFEMREGGLRVPGIIHFPAAIVENAHISSPVSIVDILPTVAEVIGNNKSLLEKMSKNTLDGTSLLPYIRGYKNLKRNKPIGFMSTQGGQYLIFDKLALRRAQGATNIYFYDIAGSGLTNNVEKVMRIIKATDTTDDFVKRFKGWSDSFKDTKCNVLSYQRDFIEYEEPEVENEKLESNNP